MTAAWSRFVALEGGYNIRDIGGYETADGHTVRRGMVFRSASLSALTDDDLETLAPLGIRLAVDLRSTSERERRPTRMTGEVWARDYDTSEAELIRALQRSDLTPALAAEMMRQSYRTLHEEQAESFALLFRRIAAGDLPVIFHCAVGKDRTGVAAALLLTLLGVSRQGVDEDYLHTRLTVHRSHADARAALAKSGTVVPEEVLAAIVGVDVSYLDATFAMIDERYGSVAGYATERLGLNDAELSAIRTQLLE